MSPATEHSPIVATVSGSQTARYTTAHSTPRQSYHSPANRNQLDGGLSHSPLPGRPSLYLLFLATSWDLVLFLCAGGPTLIFNDPLVEDDSNDSKALGKQQLQHQLPTASSY